MKKHIRIGTRKSDLSVAQTMIVVNAMKAVFPQTEVELVCRSTVGDRILDKPLVSFGGKAVFVAEFEEFRLSVGKARVCCIGEATAKRLKQYGCPADYVAQAADAEGIAQQIAEAEAAVQKQKEG